MLPARALITLVGLSAISCGSGRREPPTCEPMGDLVDLASTWDYVPRNPYREYADQQPPVGAWRDMLEAWTFTTEGAWTDSSTDAIIFELDDARDLVLQEAHATDETCKYEEITGRVEFYSEYRLSFAETGYQLTGDALSEWVGRGSGYRTSFSRGNADGPDCPCTVSISTLDIFSGVAPLDAAQLTGSGNLVLVTKTATRSFVTYGAWREPIPR